MSGLLCEQRNHLAHELATATALFRTYPLCKATQILLLREEQ